MTKPMTFLPKIAAFGMMVAFVSACSTQQTADDDQLFEPTRFVHIFETDELQRQSQSREVFGPYLSARHAAVERDYAKAAALYQEVLHKHPTSTTILSRAFMNALQSGNRDETLMLAGQLVKSSESAGISRFVIASDALSRNDYDRVVRFAGDQGAGRGMLLAPFVLAWGHAGKGDDALALKALEEMAQDVEGDFFSGLALYHQALILSYLKADGATEKFEAAIDKFGGSFRMTRALARHLAVNQSIGDAVRVLDGFAERFGAAELVAEEKARLQAADKPRLLVSSPDEGVTEALYLSAASLLAERAYGPASLYLKLVLFTQPTHDMALLMLGNLEELAKDLSAAQAAFLQIPETSPNYLEGQIKAAYALTELKQTDQALEVLDQGIAKAEGRSDEIAFRTEMLLAKAGILRGAEDFAAAHDIYDRLIDEAETRGDDPRAYWAMFYMRGMCLERMGRWPDAEQDLLRALDLSPGNALVLNYLGYSWVDQGLRLEEGRKMIELAVKKRPQDGFIVDSLGWVHYKLGNFDEAAKYLQRAVKLEPGDPVVADHYGDALWKAGRRIEARFQWRHALELDPDDDLRAKLTLKLSVGLDHAERVERSMGYDS